MGKCAKCNKFKRLDFIDFARSFFIKGYNSNEFYVCRKCSTKYKLEINKIIIKLFWIIMFISMIFVGNRLKIIRRFIINFFHINDSFVFFILFFLFTYFILFFVIIIIILLLAWIFSKYSVYDEL